MKFCQPDVIKVEVQENYVLYLTFEDGRQGKIDISKLISFKGIFEPLKDKSFFSQVYVDPKIGTLCWKNSADISPSILYDNIEMEN